MSNRANTGRQGIRVEFFGPMGAGKSTCCEKLLNMKDLFAGSGFELLNGHDLHSLIVQQSRKRESLGKKIKRRVRIALGLTGWQKLIDQQTRRIKGFDDDERYADVFGRMIAPYQGVAGHMAASRDRILWAHQDFERLGLEKHFLRGECGAGPVVFLYDEFLTQRLIALLFHVPKAASHIASISPHLPASDVYVFFNEEVAACKDGILRRNGAGESRLALTG